MCGIVGFTGHIERKEKVLDEMKERIRHRGPDSEGSYIDDDIAMGFRRLSIIDLAGGDQPIYNEDGSMVLTFNGEIYNYRELRETLIAKGHVFKTRSDSEVLVHGYEEYGTALPEKLRGMFAFVIWDKKRKRLFGARDYFGIKPLYYAEMNGALMYASEMKAFLAHPDFKRELNTDTLENYLSFQYSPLADTLMKNVYKLKPAHFFLYEAGRLQTACYWKPDFDVDDTKSLENWADDIEAAFAESVTAHKIADVEVGSFLSSGIDSSYIAAQARVDKTYTVGFKGDQYDELGYAKACADAVGLKNRGKIITEEEYWDVLPKLIYHLDEPLGDPACIALYFVAKEASKDVKVCLSGEGADEIFGGYNTYEETQRGAGYRKIPRPLREGAAGLAGALPHFKGREFIIRHRGTVEDWFAGNPNSGFDEKERKRLLRVKTGAPDRVDLVAPFYADVAGENDIIKMQYIDMHMWLASDILLKGDKMSMANSLEVRVPFLDKTLYQTAKRLPEAMRVKDRHTKIALRAAAARHLPEVTAQKKKLGFPVPLKYWMKEERYASQIKRMYHSDIGETLFDTKALDSMLDAYRQGRFTGYLKLWSVYTFLLWYEVFFNDMPVKSRF